MNPNLKAIGLSFAILCSAAIFGASTARGQGVGGIPGIGGTTGGATGGTQTNPSTGNAVGTTQGLSQTGQIQSQAALQRNQTDFVGRNGGEHPRSMASQTGATQSVNSQFNPNATTNIGGLSSSTLGGLSSLGGLGGLNSFGAASALGGRSFGGLGGFGTQGALGQGGLNQFGAQGQFGGQGQFGAQGQQTQIRTRTSIAFETIPVARTVISERFAKRITRLPGLGEVSGVQVAMDGDEAVISGTVRSTQDRDLIGRLALLEPGIRSVRNELLVQQEPDGTTGESIPVPPSP